MQQPRHNAVLAHPSSQHQERVGVVHESTHNSDLELRRQLIAGEGGGGDGQHRGGLGGKDPIPGQEMVGMKACTWQTPLQHARVFLGRESKQPQVQTVVTRLVWAFPKARIW